MLTGDALPIAKEIAVKVGIGENIAAASLVRNEPDATKKRNALFRLCHSVLYRHHQYIGCSDTGPLLPTAYWQDPAFYHYCRRSFRYRYPDCRDTRIHCHTSVCNLQFTGVFPALRAPGQ
jgi:hypothetical protein